MSEVSEVNELHKGDPDIAAEVLRTVFLVTGFIGVMHMAGSLPGLIYPLYSAYAPGVLFLIAAMACGRRRPKRWLWVLLAAVLLLAMQMRSFNRVQVETKSGNTLIEELFGLGWWLGGSPNWPKVNVTGLMPSISVLFALVIFVFSAVLRAEWILFLLVFGFLFFRMFVRGPLNVVDIMLIGFFLAGSRSLSVAESVPHRRRKKTAGAVREVEASPGGDRAGVRAALASSALFAAVALVTVIWLPGREIRLYRAAEYMRDRGQEFMDEIREWREERRQRVREGSIYQDEDVVYRVTVTTAPTSSLYLRTFVGDVYDGGVWYTYRDDEALGELYDTYFLENLAGTTYGFGRAGFAEWLERPRESRPDLLEVVTQSSPDARTPVPVDEVTVTRNRNDSRRVDMAGRVSDVEDDGATARFFRMDTSLRDPDFFAMFIPFAEVGTSDKVIYTAAELTQDVRDLELASLVMGYEADFAWPSDQLPRLASWRNGRKTETFPGFQEMARSHWTLVQANDADTAAGVQLLPRVNASPERSRQYGVLRQRVLETYREATAQVFRLLETHAKYTKELSDTPYTGDIIDAFLFQTHEGYCQQYASAAVLAYRSFGIPARYAAGYRLPSTRFEGEGPYTMTVVDEDEHAWAEIWLFGYGWIPVEVTVTREYFPEVIFPGLSGDDLLGRLLRLQRSEMSDFNFYDDELEEEGEGVLPEGYEPGGGRRRLVLPDGWEWWLIGGLAGAAVLWYVVFRIRRRMKRTVHGWFRLTVRLFHAGGWLRGFTGSEKDIAEKLANVLPYEGFPSDEFRWMALRAEQEFFGGQKTTREENRRAKKHFIRTQDELYRRAETRRSLMMRLFSVLFA